ncbi:hypothetical protein LMG3441_06209 [Achromobacter kerstersii]|uniref:Uncharacterized protein n=1 Tax=Achromobacter kerstersii TaxID=1353890 RepID=A0A6S7ARE2_9BURK|nr:hypothetical protein LMG3441_06209 [Achromobacter kerstersii]
MLVVGTLARDTTGTRVSSAACKPLTRAISERAKARLLTAAVCDTVSNAVTGSTFHPVLHAATVAPDALYLA